MTSNQASEMKEMLASWTEDPKGNKGSFLQLQQHVQEMADVKVSYVARPGISYSLRVQHVNQNKRPVLAVIDIIDDDPSDRWLSACFYREMIRDTHGLGDEVPEGLHGEDACCFDMYQWDDDLVEYIKVRLTEAWQAAGQENEAA